MAMSNYDWDRVWNEMFCTLWPKLKGVTDEERMSYRRVATNITYDQAQRVLRGIKDTNRWTPLPADVRTAIRNEIKPAHVTASEGPSDAEIERWRRESRDSWDDARQRVNELEDEEREQHKQTAIANDWRYEWMASRDSLSRGWVAIIAHRLRLGLGPDDVDMEELVPPRPTFSQVGDIGREVRRCLV